MPATDPGAPIRVPGKSAIAFRTRRRNGEPVTTAAKGSEDARFRPADLTSFAAGLLSRVGAPADRAETVGALLVEADLLGHTTHGLALLPGSVRSRAVE
jgi:hypothetical protein